MPYLDSLAIHEFLASFISNFSGGLLFKFDWVNSHRSSSFTPWLIVHSSSYPSLVKSTVFAGHSTNLVLFICNPVIFTFVVPSYSGINWIVI